MRLRLFDDDQFDYEALLALGAAYRRAADVGEVLATAARITPGGDAEAWFTAWTDLARRVRWEAEGSDARGRRVSAGEGYLRAAKYFATALVGVDATEDPGRLVPVFHEHRDCFERFGAASAPPAERVAIPYEGDIMPGFLFSPPDRSGPLPTVIVNNGSDGAITDVWSLVGAGAVARGHRVLLFDGPGQQSMLFLREVPFRHDWEHVITPVVDFLLDRPDVDPERIALVGISQGGYWVPRALAFEHRIAAAVADPGVTDVSTSWWRHIPREMRELWEAGERDSFDRYMREGIAADPASAAIWRWRSKPYGDLSPFDLFTELDRYTLAPVVDRITTPLLITAPDGEVFWPGQSEQLHDALPGPSELVRFTTDEGASLHCEPAGRAVFEQRVFDWIDERLT
ncbi:alpha/beta fold hydrolase [Nocardiopsis sp. EMB25]|uniref:alpha/beta hydrolase family protein n=1 Tax=Nocardiopsis sp. EMB25 TaxID=2835867 RepID=UPI00228339F4|nr:prolyl oligopeptidase family serine peptidase [Nocardiopsis sp. EMB25]MCY9786235.1 alpha/beta fold hydrolase [Nocardiopsis sp. EMB25]